MQEESLLPHPNSQAKLLVVPCPDPACPSKHHPNHGFVLLELGKEKQVMGEVKTRAEAYAHLKSFKTAPGVSPQPEFLMAVRRADFLTGEMPSALFTSAGQYKGGNGKPEVVSMDVQVVNGLFRAHGSTAAEDRHRMLRMRDVFSR